VDRGMLQRRWCRFGLRGDNDEKQLLSLESEPHYISHQHVFILLLFTVFVRHKLERHLNCMLGQKHELITHFI
jgi:hypothetical protein